MQPIRVFLQQRVIPVYRIPFLETLAAQDNISLTVFAGQPRPIETIKTAQSIQEADFIQTTNIHLLRGGLYACYQQNIKDALQKSQPDVIILEGNVRYLSSRHALRWAKQHSTGLIGWGLGVPLKQGFLGKPINKIWSTFLSQFDTMIAYSQTGSAQYQSIGFPKQNVFTAINATAPRPTSPPPQRPTTFDDGKATVLFVGRLQERKRLDSLIRVCAQLPVHLQPNLWIVGDGTIRTDLENIANSIYPNTRFFGGLYDRELTEIYQKADLFVLPGTGGLAVQQAMSHALPVIMAAGDGTQADLIKRENGWSIPADDERALLKYLKEALENPVKLRQKGLAAFRTIKEEINIENMVKQFMKAIVHTLADKEKR